MTAKIASHLTLALLIAAAVILRVCDWPHRDEPRHCDELPYVWGSLQLLEGITPEYKYSPAGPQTWAGWAYAGSLSAYYFIHPTPEERTVAIPVRPFVAVNHALWNCYADLANIRLVWILFAWPFIIFSIFSAFRIGYRQARLPGGILIAGIVVLLPLFVDTTNQARPYMLGWALGIIALDLAMSYTRPKGLILASIVLGLAIGTRIDMLLLAPLVWSEIWSRRKTDGFIKPIWRFHWIAAVAALLIAPWILTNLIGNLRIIATVRLSTPATGQVPLTTTLKSLFWDQGFGIVVILCMAGLFLPPPEGSRRRWLRSIYIFLLIASIFKATAFGLQHQGGPIIIALASAAAILVPIASKKNWLAYAIVALTLVLPLVQSIRLIQFHRRYYIHDQALAWIESHVPAGTRIYTGRWLTDPLPTREAADRDWAEVNGDAWQRKFAAGLARFHLTVNDLPRALSDEDMLVERGNRRGVFILGSRPNDPRPRYDFRILSLGEIFTVENFAQELSQSGGILLWRQWCSDTSMPDVSTLGEPIMKWTSPAGTGVFIYATPDIRAKLNPS